MTPETIHFETPRNQRVSHITPQNTLPTHCWMALHGFGQMAPYFIRKFEVLGDAGHVVCAPEGPHRFYLQGFSGRVGASWMTKEDRLTDIADNHRYLNSVWQEFVLNKKPQVKVALGFSQGAATLVRWACQSHSPPDHLIIWSGSFPEDINWFSDVQKLNTMRLKIVVGTEDEFISESALEEQSELLQSRGLQFELIRFEGGHDIPRGELLAISRLL